MGTDHRRKAPSPAGASVPGPRREQDRVVVEQALGVLVQRGGLTVQAAFERLVGYARRFQVGLADLAREVLESDLAAVDVLTVRAEKTLHRGDPELR